MDNKNKNPNVPNLRFKSFNGTWNRYCVSDLLESVTTNSLTWDDLNYNSGEIKNIHYGLIHKGFTETCISDTNSLIPWINEEIALRNYTLVRSGDLILADASEDRKDVGKPIEITSTHCATVSGLHTIHAKDKTDYFISGYKGFYFQSSSMKNQIYKIANGSKIYGISPNAFYELYMSVPSKKEQTKIVNLLSKIEERISAQIKIIEDLDSLKQSISIQLYDQLKLNKKLCDVCVITKGKQINGSDLLKQGRYYMMNGGIEPSGYLNQYNTIENTISISEGGNSCGYVQYNKEKFWSGGHCYTLNDLNKEINSKFLYFFLKAKEKDVMSLRIGTGLPNIQKKDIENFLIPVPNIETQNNIVKILDSISSKSDILKEQLEYYKQQKQYLLNNLFI